MSTPRVTIHNPPTIYPPTGYSHVAEVRGGKLVFISGQVALDLSGNLVGPGDYRAQAEQVFRNLGAALKAAGGDFPDLIKLTFFMLDIHHLPDVRAARDEFIDTTRPPTSTAVQVSRLARSEFLLEVEAVASIA